jgi:CheY-like chemotaxis protein
MRILICDDNMDAAFSIEVLLSLERHETHVCNDGQSCIQKARLWKPQVAFLDIGLPEMSGYAVARAVRALDFGSEVLLVAVTGWGAPEDVRLAKEAGFDLHFTKPADPVALLKVVSRQAGSA